MRQSDSAYSLVWLLPTVCDVPIPAVHLRQSECRGNNRRVPFGSDGTASYSYWESFAAPACGCWCAGLQAFPVLRHVRTGSDAVVRFLP